MKQLSAAAPRGLLHTRQVQCTGYEREDGPWDVEGRMSDVRTHDALAAKGHFARKAGEPFHLMSLRITLDDSFLIVAAEACTHQAPYGECGDINAAYGQLAGLRIEAGFQALAKARFRGTLGCTHLTELLGPMATTALQAIRPALERRRLQAGLPSQDMSGKRLFLDSCHGLRSGGLAVLARWPEPGPRG